MKILFFLLCVLCVSAVNSPAQTVEQIAQKLAAGSYSFSELTQSEQATLMQSMIGSPEFTETQRNLLSSFYLLLTTEAATQIEAFNETSPVKISPIKLNDGQWYIGSDIQTDAIDGRPFAPIRSVLERLKYKHVTEADFPKSEEIMP